MHLNSPRAASCLVAVALGGLAWVSMPAMAAEPPRIVILHPPPGAVYEFDVYDDVAEVRSTGHPLTGYVESDPPAQEVIVTVDPDPVHIAPGCVRRYVVKTTVAENGLRAFQLPINLTSLPTGRKGQ